MTAGGGALLIYEFFLIYKYFMFKLVELCFFSAFVLIRHSTGTGCNVYVQINSKCYILSVKKLVNLLHVLRSDSTITGGSSISLVVNFNS